MKNEIKSVFKKYVSLGSLVYMAKAFIAVSILLFGVAGLTYGLVIASSLLMIFQGQTLQKSFELIFDHYFFLGVFTTSAMAMLFYFWLASKGIFKEAQKNEK